MVIPRFVQWALKNETIQVYGDGQQTRCFCNVSDVVDAMTRLADCDPALGEVFNIGSQEEISILDLAQRIKERTGSSSEIQMVSYSDAYEAGFEDMQRRVPDIAKINRVIGWEPKKSLDQTLDEVISYFRARNA
jgi:UDP-glucose 4-epimerase